MVNHKKLYKKENRYLVLFILMVSTSLSVDLGPQRKAYLQSMMNSDEWQYIVYPDFKQRSQTDKFCKETMSYCDTFNLKIKLIQRFNTKSLLANEVIRDIQKYQRKLNLNVPFNNKLNFKNIIKKRKIRNRKKVKSSIKVSLSKRISSRKSKLSFRKRMKLLSRFLRNKKRNRRKKKNGKNKQKKGRKLLLSLDSMFDGSLLSKLLKTERYKQIKQHLKIVAKLRKHLKELYKKDSPSQWLQSYEQENKRCLEAEFQLISDSTCLICTSNDPNLYFKDARFKINMNTCTSLLDKCTGHWKQVINLHDVFEKVSKFISEEDSDNVNSLKNAINSDSHFWEKIDSYSGKSDNNTKKQLCSYFFNVLDYTPKIFQSKEVQKVITGGNIIDRLLLMSHSKHTRLSKQVIGELGVSNSYQNNHGGSISNISYISSIDINVPEDQRFDSVPKQKQMNLKQNNNSYSSYKNYQNQCQIMWGNPNSYRGYNNQLSNAMSYHNCNSAWNSNNWQMY